MSFILDALKKSELERQRQSIPGLVDSGMVRPRARRPVWVIALALLLGGNLLALLFVLTRGWVMAPNVGDAPTAVTSRRTAAAAKDSPAGAQRRARDGADASTNGIAAPFSPLDASDASDAPVYAPEIPVTAAVLAPPPAEKPASSGGFGSHAVRRRDPLLTDEDYKPQDEEVLPTVNELNLTGAQALPELHLDVHVFATKAAERFVYVNMRKYHEGGTLQEGPTIERIRRDGVILDYRGLRFLLPRQ